MRKDVRNEIIRIGGDNINKSEMARIMGCSRQTIYNREERLKNPKQKKEIVRTSKLDSYKGIIDTKVDKYRSKGMNVYKFIKKQGYTGGYGIVRKYIKEHKNEQIKKATIRFETVPGLQAQVDWKESMRLVNKKGETFEECNMSYSDYLDYWLNNYCKINLKYNTIQAYTNIINKHIIPKLGKYRLSTLTSMKLNSFITEICEENDFAPAYFKNILKVLKGSFREACNVYGFIKYNPARDLRLPRFDKRREDVKHLYTQKEIDLILNRFTDNDTFTCVFLTSCYTGMRTGEVCALTWDNIDLEKGIIKIEHNVYDKPKDDKGRWYLGTTKTETGTRKVHICNTLQIALQNYKKKQDYLKKIYGRRYAYYNLEDVVNRAGKVVEHRIVRNEIKTDDSLNLVFTREDGTYIGTDVTKYPYKIIHNELGIKKCRFYDLRGSYATKILKNGVEIRDVADILGHKNIETTENFYISSTEDSRKYATDIFDNITKSETIDKIIKYKV